MKAWYQKIVQAQGDAETVARALEHFIAEYEDGRSEIDRLQGERLITVESHLPGLVCYRYEQWKELGAIIDYLQIREDAVVGAKRRHYMECYNRTLNPTMVERYAETDAEVLDWRELRCHVAAVRGKFEALLKQHEFLHFQLTNITRLRVACMEEAIL